MIARMLFLFGIIVIHGVVARGLVQHSLPLPRAALASCAPELGPMPDFTQGGVLLAYAVGGPALP